jgi:predicted glycoside hydrolase/deacetylase ChbG (UPF0249 family)
VKIHITADDYGLDAGVNRAIEALAESGAISAATVMCHPDAALDSIARLRDSGIRLGAHLTFVEERPLRDDRALAPVLDASGRFPKNYKYLFAAIVRHPKVIPALVREGEAQLERYLDLKLRLDLFTSHQHVHLFPPLWSALAMLLERTTAQPRVAAAHWAKPTPQVLLGAASVMAERVRPLPGREVVRPLGLNCSGRLNRSALLKLLDVDVARAASRGGMPELVVHPGVETQRMRNRYGHWKFQWEQEFELLQSSFVRESLAARGLSLAELP